LRKVYRYYKGILRSQPCGKKKSSAIGSSYLKYRTGTEKFNFLCQRFQLFPVLPGSYEPGFFENSRSMACAAGHLPFCFFTILIIPLTDLVTTILVIYAVMTGPTRRLTIFFIAKVKLPENIEMFFHKTGAAVGSKIIKDDFNIQSLP
jgi:hypothetical protein